MLEQIRHEALGLQGLFEKVQICNVVTDLEVSMKHFGALMGVGSFAVYDVDSNDLPGVTYRGKPADYRIQVAIADVGTWQLELMQHHRGQSVYREFVDERGTGIHHLGFFVKDEADYQGTCNELVRQGYPHLQGGPILGKHRDGHFDYFDTQQHLGLIVELLDMPEFSEDLTKSL